ncbi:hypothetical protein M427DRAFT_60505 [Gonapodya prolifera JEL478]|uniref:Uncharacterized protein n=1 Tax=Gonapodya prolifera (strain JEL478) TaxID=1344416 RepID=A0A139A4U7_GONPJ|nr:hypothetical protein M427DRAFT_60505 [Gonapodya prolifera JEL478]|eukprot:KXS11648.1 hypothetical protein M427DRAFT_60505 [Gonapodya prolifera JEL478]
MEETSATEAATNAELKKRKNRKVKAKQRQYEKQLTSEAPHVARNIPLLQSSLKSLLFLLAEHRRLSNVIEIYGKTFTITTPVTKGPDDLGEVCVVRQTFLLKISYQWTTVLGFLREFIPATPLPTFRLVSMVTAILESPLLAGKSVLLTNGQGASF